MSTEFSITIVYHKLIFFLLLFKLAFNQLWSENYHKQKHIIKDILCLERGLVLLYLKHRKNFINLERERRS